MDEFNAIASVGCVALSVPVPSFLRAARLRGQSDSLPRCGAISCNVQSNGSDECNETARAAGGCLKRVVVVLAGSFRVPGPRLRGQGLRRGMGRIPGIRAGSLVGLQWLAGFFQDL